MVVLSKVRCKSDGSPAALASNAVYWEVGVSRAFHDSCVYYLYLEKMTEVSLLPGDKVAGERRVCKR